MQQSQITNNQFTINGETPHNIASINNLNSSNNDNEHQNNEIQNSHDMSLGNNGRSQNRDYKIIAKPLPSRPTPFLHHGLNHTHLHSLLAHCRSPYIGGKNI